MLPVGGRLGNLADTRKKNMWRNSKAETKNLNTFNFCDFILVNQVYGS